MADIGTARRPAWSGWITFAGVLLAVLGVLNILEGLVALLNNQVAFIDGDSLVVLDLTGLGVVMVVFGALLLLSGLGLLLRNRVARVTAIVIVALHALSQIAWLGAYPVWSLLMITLDVLVLFALTVHWAPREVPAATAATPSGGTGGVHRADHQPRDAEFPMNQPRPPGAPASPAAERYGPGAETPRTPAAGTPRNPDAETPRTPAAGTPRNPDAETSRTPAAGTPRTPAAHRAEDVPAAPTSGPGARPR